MTKEKLKKAMELNSRINKLERDIENLQNNKEHRITSKNSKGNTCTMSISQEIIDFTIASFVKEKEELEKEFNEL